MAVRGFTIDDLIDPSVELNKPPFLHSKAQFDQHKVHTTDLLQLHKYSVIGHIWCNDILNSVFKQYLSSA